MKYPLRLLILLCLVTGLVTARGFQASALGQARDQPPKSPSTPTAGGGHAAHEDPVQEHPIAGYTRMNKHTGRPEQVRPHKRRPPKPKPVEVQSYTRQGRPVTGHQRQQPAGSAPGGKPKSQSSRPYSGGFRRSIA